MQHADRVSHIEALAPPGRYRGTRVDLNAVRIVLRTYRVAGILRHCRRRRNIGQWRAVRPPETQFTVRTSLYLVALLVHRTVMPPTEEREIRERRRAALGPVAEMMSLPEADAAAREAAAPVPMMEGAA